MSSHKVSTFLWFNDKAEEAAHFYTSIFKNSKIHDYLKTGDGKVNGVTFEINGQVFQGFNGGPHFQFTPAISLFVDCKTQEEVDELWAKLTEGGEEVQCGWLKDKYGLSWQIVPSVLSELLYDKDAAKAQRAMKAMMGMKKLDIEGLKRAHEGIEGV